MWILSLSSAALLAAAAAAASSIHNAEDSILFLDLLCQTRAFAAPFVYSHLLPPVDGEGKTEENVEGGIEQPKDDEQCRALGFHERWEPFLPDGYTLGGLKDTEIVGPKGMHVLAFSRKEAGTGEEGTGAPPSLSIVFRHQEEESPLSGEMWECMGLFGRNFLDLLAGGRRREQSTDPEDADERERERGSGHQQGGVFAPCSVWSSAATTIQKAIWWFRSWREVDYVTQGINLVEDISAQHRQQQAAAAARGGREGGREGGAGGAVEGAGAEAPAKDAPSVIFAGYSLGGAVAHMMGMHFDSLAVGFAANGVFDIANELYPKILARALSSRFAPPPSCLTCCAEGGGGSSSVARGERQEKKVPLSVANLINFVQIGDDVPRMDCQLASVVCVLPSEEGQQRPQRKGGRGGVGGGGGGGGGGGAGDQEEQRMIDDYVGKGGDDDDDDDDAPSSRAEQLHFNFVFGGNATALLGLQTEEAAAFLRGLVSGDWPSEGFRLEMGEGGKSASSSSSGSSSSTERSSTGSWGAGAAFSCVSGAEWNARWAVCEGTLCRPPEGEAPEGEAAATAGGEQVPSTLAAAAGA